MLMPSAFREDRNESMRDGVISISPGSLISNLSDPVGFSARYSSASGDISA